METNSNNIQGFLPNNLFLPFFTYGIFRPGEIAYDIIKEFVDETKIQHKTIKGNIMLRDGLLIFEPTPKMEINGYVLYFKQGKEYEAYRRISELEPKEYYTWSHPRASYISQYNILYAYKSEIGIDEMKSEFGDTLFDSLFSSIWNDPFINNGLKLIKHFKEIKTFEDCEKGTLYPNWPEANNFNKYLKLQMIYLFLWSIIERFTFLAYGLGLNSNQRNKQLADDEDLHHVVERLRTIPEFDYFKFGFSRKISRTDEPKDKTTWTVEPSSHEMNYKKMIDYYYKLRSNITHRGKSGIKNTSNLDKSLSELMFIIEELWQLKKFNAELTKTRIDKLIFK